MRGACSAVAVALGIGIARAEFTWVQPHQPASFASHEPVQQRKADVQSVCQAIAGRCVPVFLNSRR